MGIYYLIGDLKSIGFGYLSINWLPQTGLYLLWVISRLALYNSQTASPLQALVLFAT